MRDSLIDFTTINGVMKMELMKDSNGRTVFKIEGSQKAIADLFSVNWPKAPLVHVGIQVNVDDANTFRKSYGAENKTKISLTNMIQKAAAEACKSYPLICGLWEGDDKVIVPTDDAISVGGPIMVGDVALPHLLENAGLKSLIEIANETQEIVNLVRQSELSEKIAQEGFQKMLSIPNLGISNIGMIAPVNFFIAMPVLPTVAALCVSSMIETPIVKDGKIVIANVVNFHLSFDHRVLQAGIVAKFLGLFKELLEDPERLIS